jgi:hypothetical protein
LTDPPAAAPGADGGGCHGGAAGLAGRSAAALA